MKKLFPLLLVAGSLFLGYSCTEERAPDPHNCCSEHPFWAPHVTEMSARSGMSKDWVVGKHQVLDATSLRVDSMKGSGGDASFDVVWRYDILDRTTVTVRFDTTGGVVPQELCELRALLKTQNVLGLKVYVDHTDPLKLAPHFVYLWCTQQGKWRLIWVAPSLRISSEVRLTGIESSSTSHDALASCGVFAGLVGSSIWYTFPVIHNL